MSRTKRPSKNSPPFQIGELVECKTMFSSRVRKDMLGIVIDLSFIDSEWFATAVFDDKEVVIYSNYLKKVKQ